MWRWRRASSCQKGERRGGRGWGEAADAEERARTSLRLQPPAAALSFSGARPPPSPPPSSSSSRAVAALFPFSASAPLAPGSPGTPSRSPALGRRRGKAKGTPGNRKSGRERAGRRGKKLRAAGRGEKFSVAACSEPACGEGFLPLPRVWAARGPGAAETEGDCRAPAGRTGHSGGRREAPCPGDAGCGPGARTPAAAGRFSDAGKTHSPAASRGGGRLESSF